MKRQSVNYYNIYQEPKLYVDIDSHYIDFKMDLMSLFVLKLSKFNINNK